ncbi:glycosyltransferase family 2 protein [Acidocella sp.]|uniref:glycosyltransferase family 2 protein n=1 Tax=Acidocella sp. TaxID=50710 RepID=UPI003D02B415
MHSAITIVIPTLNRLELAKRALASAMAQTVPVEIILSDNGSTDGTNAYFSSLTVPKNIRYFHRDITIPVQDHGAFLRERVMTEWVVFLSDDDELEPTFAEQCLHLIRERPNLTFTYTAAYLIYDGFQRPGKFGPRFEKSADFLMNFMRGQRNICMCATVFRIADLHAIPSQPADRFIGDMYYWVRLLSNGGEVGCVGQYLSHYHFYRPTVSNETGRMNIEQWHAESRELADIMTATILNDPTKATDEDKVRALAAQFVAMSTILQTVWNALRNVPRISLLGAMTRLAPSLCSGVESTIYFTLYGTATIILPLPILRRALLWHVRRMTRKEALKSV